MTHAPDPALDRVFAALADPTRRAILALLLEDDMAVTDVAAPFAMSLAAVSKHLAILRSSDFVERRKEGLYAFYSVVDPSVSELCDIMCGRLEEQAEAQTAILATGS